MQTPARSARCNIPLLGLAVIIAFTTNVPRVLADYEPVINLNPDKHRLIEKKQETQSRQEKITAEHDRFYNEVTQQEEANFFEQNVWTLLALGLLFLVMLRLAFYRRDAEPAVAGADQIFSSGDEAGADAAKAEHKPKPSFIMTLLSFLRGSRRRHRSRSHRHRHRSRY